MARERSRGDRTEHAARGDGEQHRREAARRKCRKQPVRPESQDGACHHHIDALKPRRDDHASPGCRRQCDEDGRKRGGKQQQTQQPGQPRQRLDLTRNEAEEPEGAIANEDETAGEVCREAWHTACLCDPVGCKGDIDRRCDAIAQAYREYRRGCAPEQCLPAQRAPHAGGFTGAAERDPVAKQGEGAPNREQGPAEPPRNAANAHEKCGGARGHDPETGSRADQRKRNGPQSLFHLPVDRIAEGRPRESGAQHREKNPEGKNREVGRDGDEAHARCCGGEAQNDGRPGPSAGGQELRNQQADEEPEKAETGDEARCLKRDREDRSEFRQEEAEAHSRRTIGNGGGGETGGRQFPEGRHDRARSINRPWPSPLSGR